MIRIGDNPFFAVRQRALAAGLGETFEGSSLRPSRDPATGDVLAEDPRGRQTRFGFDRRGFINSVSSPMGRLWGVESDAKGRPESFTNPAGARLDLAYDPAGRIARIGRGGTRTVCEVDHDHSGHVAGYRYPGGTATRLDRDPQGRIVRMTDRRGVARTFDHGADGLLEAMTDGRGHQTRFAYEILDRPSRLTYPDGSSEAFGYDPAGLACSIRADDGTGVVITRDDAGRPETIDAGGGDVSRFAHDDQGHIVRAENSTTVVEFEYDADGRLIAESREGEVVRYEYDDVGTLIAMEYPTGERVRFGRDDDLRLTQVVDWAGGVYGFEHPGDDRWLTIRAPSGLVASIELTPEGQVAEVSVRTPLRPSVGGKGPSGGEDLFATTYRYDDEDRLASVVDSEHGERLHRYDAEGNLVAAGREVFAYDPAGNRVQDGGEVAEFDPADRLISQGSLRCEYDPRGNLVAWLDRAETWRFQYDGRNRMTRAEGQSGRVVTFGYDAFGRRAWKTSGNVTTRFVWAGEQVIREVRSDGTSRDYLYPPGSPTPLAIRDRGMTYTVHADHLGTPRRLTDPQGRIAWSGDGDAFGRTRVSASTVTNPIRFPGHYHDEETGLHYNRFRYYSLRLGRYLSRDPASYLGGLNLYAYAGNDPINVIDPMGLWPSWRTVLPIVAAVAVGVAVVLLAPVALPAAIILAGAAAGAVGAGLNQGLNEGHFCADCIAKAALKGALVGTVASVPFALLPVGAGVLAYGGVGGLSGGIGYTADHMLNPGSQWSWTHLGQSVALGVATGGAGRYLGGRYAQSRGVETPPLESSVTPHPEPSVTPPLEPSVPPASPTSVTPQTQEKILYGDRIVKDDGTPTQKLIGGHSADITNQPNYTFYDKQGPGNYVEIPKANAATNPDGTRVVYFKKEYSDGTMSSNFKKSTIAPDSWSNDKIMNTTQQVGESPPVGVRGRDGATWHRQTVDGVEWDVIKDSTGNVTSSYPTGGNADLIGGFAPPPP